MSDQLAIDGTGVPTDPHAKLTERQRYALEQIGQRGPIPSVDLGALLHEYRPAEAATHHPADETCPFCKSEGASMGARLRELDLVRFRRGEGWVLVGAAARTAGGTGRAAPSYDPATVPIPF